MDNSHNGRRVVVTGLGAVSPVGLNVPDMWQSLIAGRSGVGNISSFDTAAFDTKFAAEVKGFDATQYVERKEARHMDRFTQFAVAASFQAVQAAKLSIDASNAEEVGVIIGNSVCGLLSVSEQIHILAAKGPRRVSPVLAPTMTGDAASVQVSLLLGSKGVNYAPSSACSSGTDAIGQAYETIRLGNARAMIAGGTEAPIIPVVLAAFNAIRALSTKNSDPQQACRPFDAERDGFVMGEGAAVMVLEDAEYALQRGAPILAELVSYGATSDAFHLTQPSPDGEGATRAVMLALKREDAAMLELGGPRTGDIVYALDPAFGLEHGEFLPTAAWGIGDLRGLFIMAGPGVKQGVEIERVVRLVDVVPTVCHLAEWPVPAHCEGGILYQALEDPNAKNREIESLRRNVERLKRMVERPPMC
jgi:3-oxoacyl-[acyl-carrier-protein] synthase II